MNNHDEKKTIRNKVLDAIRSGRVTMRPKWHFMLRAALLATGVVLVLCTILYLASFVVFIARQTGVWFVPIFGGRGWFAFLVSLPWMLIFLSLLFVVLLEILVRRYEFAYRRPLLYSVLGVALAVLLGTFVVSQTAFHRQLFRTARENHLPFAGGFYRQFGMQRFRDIHRGVIASIVPGGFVMQESDGATSTILIMPRTHLPLGADFSIGDTAVVFGENVSGTVRAFGIREIEE